jgi:hypothetical protein
MEYAGGNISTGSTVVDWGNGRAQAFSVMSAHAIAAPTNGSVGATYLLRLQQDGTGSKQLTWNTVFQWQGGITPTLGGASAVDIVGFYYDGTAYYGRHDTLSVTVAGGSVTSTELSAVSAAAASADATLSTRITSVQSSLSTTQSSLSALSADVTSAKDRLSALSSQVTSADNAISNAVSIVSVAVVSVNNRVSALRYQKGITIEDPVAGDDIDLGYFESAVTIRRIAATMIGATTPTAVWTLRTDSVRSAAGTEIITGGQTQSSTSAAQSYTTLNQSAVGAGNLLWLEVTSVGGSVDSLHATIIYTKD